MFGKITNIADYGCFVEIEEGVEGLVHVSEMDWTNKNVNPAKVVQVGRGSRSHGARDRRRAPSHFARHQAVPVQSVGGVSADVNRGDTVVGQIKSITDFGIFIGLDGGIDGLVHLSDISWEVPGEEAVRNYKKGQEIEAVVLAIDSERERISLGIKQLDKDPFSGWLAEHPKNSIVKGIVTEVDARSATVDLGDGVIGSLRASELTRGRVEDARTMIKVGDEIEAKFINVDRKNRSVALSIKAKEEHEEAEALSSYKSESGSGADRHHAGRVAQGEDGRRIK